VKKWLKWILFVGIFVIPLALLFVTTSISFKVSKSIQFCSSCHKMSLYAKDLLNPASDSLASRHYRDRGKQPDQCAACHVNYNMLGPIDAKARGLLHLAFYYFDYDVARELKLYLPYPNKNCLFCHSQMGTFKEKKHHEEFMCELKSGKLSCLSCHGPIHKIERD